MSRAAYVRMLLTLYRGLSQTTARRPSPADRRLAAQLFDQEIPLPTLEAAFLLAMARRHARPPELPPLAPIRSLAYFLPLLEEIQRAPADPAYLDYLRRRNRRHDQIPTFPGER